MELFGFMIFGVVGLFLVMVVLVVWIEFLGLVLVCDGVFLVVLEFEVCFEVEGGVCVCFSVVVMIDCIGDFC